MKNRTSYDVMDDIVITHNVLSVDECTKRVTSQSCGAISVFIGTTRDNFNGKKVVRLEYEAYEPMAVKEMNKICVEIRKKWTGVEAISMHHRLGEVPVAEASIIIAVASPHRQEALEAVHYAIDTLKATVPVWKKEIYEDGTQWKQNQECPWAVQK